MFESVWIETALEIQPSKRRFAHYNRIISDSRKVQPGDLFIALIGEKMDGHDYVMQAITKGASGVIVHQPISTDSSSVDVYEVKDTLTAYRKLGADWRKKFNIPVIAVTGSVGKTTTKEILTSLLQGAAHSVLKTEGSQNGYVGIPMTLLELRHEHKAAVIEIGIDEKDAMIQHMNLVEPTACILTAIGPEHLEKLIDIETVAHEELLSLEWTNQHDGKIAINLDDPYIAPTLKHWKPHNTVTFSVQDKKASSYVEWNESRRELTIHEYFGEKNKKQSFKIESKLPGVHNARNFAGAFAIARACGFESQPLIDGFTHQFEGAVGRSRWERLSKREVDVLCDYYNASPVSVAAALDVIGSHQTRGKKWAILADMLELGPLELDFHRALAPKIKSSGVSQVFLFGERMKSLVEELTREKFSGTVIHFDSIDELTKAATQQLSQGDTCLIKGSRSMKMERVWKALHDSESQS